MRNIPPTYSNTTVRGQRKVSLDDPITKYVTGFDTHGKTITAEHLLSHTSGLPNCTATPDYEKGMRRDPRSAEILRLVAGKPLEFEPGRRFRYSNTNYVLLGMLIEKVPGRPYAEHLQASVVKPLGLAAVPRRMSCYTASRWRPSTKRHS